MEEACSGNRADLCPRATLPFLHDDYRMLQYFVLFSFALLMRTITK